MQGAFELNPDFKFNTVRERDMDLLFLETIGSDINFANMIVNHTKWAGKQFEVKSVELSRIDAELRTSMEGIWREENVALRIKNTMILMY